MSKYQNADPACCATSFEQEPDVGRLVSQREGKEFANVDVNTLSSASTVAPSPPRYAMLSPPAPTRPLNITKKTSKRSTFQISGTWLPKTAFECRYACSSAESHDTGGIFDLSASL